MRTSKFTNEQIVQALRQAESGSVPVLEICRKLGVSELTFYRWKKKFTGLDLSELRELRQIREENRKLKQLVADLGLDKTILQEALKKNGKPGLAARASGVGAKRLPALRASGVPCGTRTSRDDPLPKRQAATSAFTGALA